MIIKQFNARNLKQVYIQGEIEDFCEALDFDADELLNARGDESYYLSGKDIEKLKRLRIFPEWVEI